MLLASTVESSYSNEQDQELNKSLSSLLQTNINFFDILNQNNFLPNLYRSIEVGNSYWQFNLKLILPVFLVYIIHYQHFFIVIIVSIGTLIPSNNSYNTHVEML